MVLIEFRGSPIRVTATGASPDDEVLDVGLYFNDLTLLTTLIGLEGVGGGTTSVIVTPETAMDPKGVWTTPERQPGTMFTVSRFAGNGGLGFTGTLDGKPITATLTPGQCSDGMSDSRYPFVATIAFGGETFAGCGYTTRQPFTVDTAP